MFNRCDIQKIDLISNNGRKINLIAAFNNVMIYESIYDYFIHGSITFTDSYDLIKNLPIIGNEIFEIRIVDKNSSMIDLKFKIYKLDKDSGPTEGENKTNVIRLYFYSFEKLIFENKCISRKFSGSSDVILNELLDFSKTEKSKNFVSTDNLEYYSNFWLLNKNIDFILKKSLSDYSDFVFFENFDGFHFISISELMTKKSVDKIYYSKLINETLNTSNIKSFQFNSYFNLLMNMKLGINGQKSYFLQEDNYNLKVIEKDFRENIEKIVTVGKSLSFSEELFTTDNLISFSYEENEVNTEKRIQKNFSKNLLKSYNFVVNLNGDFNRKSGNLVEIEFPNFDNETIVNESFAGNYLITGIKHMINSKTEYDQNLLLVKNSLFKHPELSEQTTNVNL